MQVNHNEILLLRIFLLLGILLHTKSYFLVLYTTICDNFIIRKQALNEANFRFRRMLPAIGRLQPIRPIIAIAGSLSGSIAIPARSRRLPLLYNEIKVIRLLWSYVHQKYIFRVETYLSIGGTRCKFLLGQLKRNYKGL